MKKVAKSLRAHRPLILNWFRAKGAVSAGIVEGLNNKVKVTTRKAYGYRSFRTMEVALYHTLGKLPEPGAGPYREVPFGASIWYYPHKGTWTRRGRDA